MATTIQISNELLRKLQEMKIHAKESYEELLWDLVEDRMELSNETKKNIGISENEIRQGKTISFDEIKKKMSM